MRILWADLAKARQNLIESKALDNEPFLSRFWHHHLRWLCSFLKSAVSIKARGIGCASRRRYYRLADRLFGGTRDNQYCEQVNRDNGSRRQKVRTLKKQLQENAERRFDGELQYQALTNPHFVTTNHPHQDRH